MSKRIWDIFPDSVHIKTLMLEESNDIDIWALAKDKGYVIVTQDSDFNDIAMLKGFPPYVVWIRTGNTKLAKIENCLRKNYLKIINLINSEECGVIEIS